MKREKSHIASIFGQIEGVVAHAMAAEGKVKLISPEFIPPTALYNEAGERAFCALVFDRVSEAEFDRRVCALRA